MDIVSHGLWGGIAFGRKSRKRFWYSFLFGIAPDFLAFSPFVASIILGFSKRPDFSSEPPRASFVPPYVYHIYNVTHSLFVFAAVFLLLWLFTRRPVIESLAWGLHIVMDIFTHSSAFFPTPFLWPFSRFEVNGYPWGHPIILVPDALLLIILYSWFYLIRPRLRAMPESLRD